VTNKKELITDLLSKHSTISIVSLPKVQPTDASSVVELICSQCNISWNTKVRATLKSVYCPACQVKGGWISRFKIKHGDLYDYSKSKVVDSKTPIDIICPEHGVFQKSPSNHAHKSKPQGCPVCLTEEKRKGFWIKLIKEFNSIHGDKFTYDFFSFINSKTPIPIKCEVHGIYSLRIDSHKKGVGCPDCDNEINEINYFDNLVKKFNTIHNSNYQYAIEKYKGYNSRLEIVCLKHGVFKLKPATHMKGVGCPECEGKLFIEKGDTKNFIIKANDIHKNEYFYTNTIFTKLTDKVFISCQKHGEFQQLAFEHLNGRGCPSCAAISRGKALSISKQDTIKKFNTVHKNKYSYPPFEINEGVKTKILIECPMHGSFYQSISSHKSGAGCLQCANETKSNSYTLSQKDIIDRLIIIHGEKYDFSKVLYKSSKDPIKVICHKHGEFKMPAGKLLKGSNCPTCVVERKTNDIEHFISKAKKVHGILYDYSRADYITAHKSIIIKCKTHGHFEQTPNNHIRGQGCPLCGEINRQLVNKDPNTACIVYYLKLKHNHLIFYKVGITTNSIKQRFRSLNADKVQLLEHSEFKTTLMKALLIERQILIDFCDEQLLTTKILVKTGGGTECFCDDVLGNNDLILEDYEIIDYS